MSKDPFLKNWNCGQIVSGLKKKYPGKIWKKSCQWMNCVYIRVRGKSNKLKFEDAITFYKVG